MAHTASEQAEHATRTKPGVEARIFGMMNALHTIPTETSAKAPFYVNAVESGFIVLKKCYQVGEQNVVRADRPVFLPDRFSR